MNDGTHAWAEPVTATEVIEVAAGFLKGYDVTPQTTWVVGHELHDDMQRWVDTAGRPVMHADLTLFGLPVVTRPGLGGYGIRLVEEGA